jgi:hypothetical protein
MSNSTSQAYFSADFGEHGGRFDWMTHEEITQWVTKLQNDWDWIGKQRYQPCQNARQAIAQPLINVTNFLNQAINQKNIGKEQQAQSLLSAKRELENLIRKYPWLLPNQSQRLFVEELCETRKETEAALIVAYWMGQDFNNNAPVRQSINAILAWELHARGIRDRMKTENVSLKRLAGNMQTALMEFQESERTQTDRFEELHGQITEQATAQQGAFDSSQAARETQWQEQLSGMEAELNNLKETYDKHMALAAPVEYWESKRKRHKMLSIASFISVTFCMVLAGWLLHAELQMLAVTALQADAATSVVAAGQAATNGVKTTLQSSTAWQLGSFLLLATLGFWFIRLLVRIFLSNLHLENDAAERVTMAKTYLALLRDGGLPKDDSINTVLAALFRPTGDGIVKDEGLPPTAMEWVTKLGGK